MRDPREMTAAAVNRELRQLTVLESTVNDRLIQVGFGGWKWREIEQGATAGDRLCRVAVGLSARRSELSDEITARCGPGYCRFPPGKWRPRTKKENP